MPAPRPAPPGAAGHVGSVRTARRNQRAGWPARGERRREGEAPARTGHFVPCSLVGAPLQAVAVADVVPVGCGPERGERGVDAGCGPTPVQLTAERLLGVLGE